MLASYRFKLQIRLGSSSMVVDTTKTVVCLDPIIFFFIQKCRMPAQPALAEEYQSYGGERLAYDVCQGSKSLTGRYVEIAGRTSTRTGTVTVYIAYTCCGSTELFQTPGMNE